jgi:hypothetical protein
VLAAILEPFVGRYDARELRTTLENLQIRIEHGDSR